MAAVAVSVPLAMLIRVAIRDADGYALVLPQIRAVAARAVVGARGG